jgi:pilus assembly protein CpaE
MIAALRKTAPAAAASTPAFLACVVDEVTRETVSRVAGQLGWAQAKIKPGGIDAARNLLEEGEEPSLLLVDLSEAGDPLKALQPLADACPADTTVLTIGSLNDVALYRSLIGLGIADYLVKPVSAEALSEALTRASRPPEAHAASAPAQTKLIAVLGTRGGVGATSIAASLGWSMAHDMGLRVALLDLDLQFGNLALGFDLEPGRGLREALEFPERIDPLLLTSAMVNVGEKLRILAAEEPLDHGVHFQPDAVPPLLDALSSDFDIVVADLPRRVDAASRAVLEVAANIAVVTDMSLSGMRDGQRLLAMTKTIRPETPPIIVANRVGSVPGELPRAEFEKGLGKAVDILVPFEAKAATATAESAKPITGAAPNGKAATELKLLATRLAGKAPAAKRSLLKRLLG